MGLLGNLFGGKKEKTIDSYFGELKNFNLNGKEIVWQLNYAFLNANPQILIAGDREGLLQRTKLLLLNALDNEAHIKAELEDGA